PFPGGLEPPRQRRVLAVELLVPVVPPAPDRLGEQEPGRDRVHEEPDTRARAAHDPRADERPEDDDAPPDEPALPGGERPVPTLVARLVVRGDDVIEPGADDPGDHAPD